MWSITINLMKKNIRMLIPAGIAILIGTAFIASTFLFGNAMNDSLRSQMTAQFGGANYVVQPKDNNDAAYGHTVADFKLDKVAAIDGVNGVRADVEAQVNVTKGDTHASVAAVNTSAHRSLLPVTVSSGTQPSGDDQIALPSKTADRLHAGIGDTVIIGVSAMNDTGTSASHHVKVVGLTEDPNGAYSYYDGAALLSENSIAEVTGAADGFSSARSYSYYLDVDGSKTDEALPKIRALIPDSQTLYARDKAADEAVKTLGGGDTSIVTMFLLAFGILAMFVAALVIANTFQVLVAQQRRTLALLRTIGAKKGQLYRSVVAQAGLLGLVASLLGIGAGIGLMALMTNTGILRSIGLNANLVLSWQVFAIPLAFGVVMTILASMGSAHSATSVTPLEALRPIELTVRRSGWIRALFSIILLAAGVVATVFSVWNLSQRLASGDLSNGSISAEQLLLIAIAGCALVFLGLVFSATFWLPLLMRGVGALMALTGPSSKIAHANVQKNPRRVAATGTALLIGVTLVTSIATGAATGKQTINDSLDSRYSVDVVLDGPGLTQQTADKVAKAQGVEASLYAPVATATTKDQGGKQISMMLIGVDSLGKIASVIHTDLQGVSFGGDDVLVAKYSASTGKELQFKDGQAVITPVQSDGGTDSQTRTLNVRQADFRRVTARYDATGFVHDDLFSDGTLKSSSHIMLVRLNTATGSQSLADTFQNIQTIASADDQVQVTGPIATRIQWESVINTMLALLVGLLAVAVLIALIGVANTLSLSVIERTRESATLRAIGMTKGQLRRSLAVEALLLALVSGLAGIVLGTAFGWIGSYMVFSQFGDVSFTFDWATCIAVLVVAAVAALLASVLPARRAVRTSPVEALAEA